MAAVRIAGITLPNNKRVFVALQYIYGVGPRVARVVLSEAKIEDNPKVDSLTEAQVIKLRELVEKNHRVEGDLKREILLNIKRLKEIGSYRGARHSKNLPTRGQRTKTNSRTVRGNVRRTMGSGRKPSAEKT